MCLSFYFVIEVSLHKLRQLSCFIIPCRCDADPSALANYVVALVKKDKPEKELKALCADQLDVFLQKGTSFTEDDYDALMNVLAKQVHSERHCRHTSLSDTDVEKQAIL